MAWALAMVVSTPYPLFIPISSFYDVMLTPYSFVCVCVFVVSVRDVAFSCDVLERGTVDSLGGDYYWAAGLSLISNLPPKPHWPLKAHFFLNAGQLQGSQPGTSAFFPSSTVSALSSSDYFCPPILVGHPHRQIPPRYPRHLRLQTLHIRRRRTHLSI